MNNLRISLIISLFFMSCQSQEKNVEKTFACNGKSMTINLPKLIDEKEHNFAEGKTELLQTKDSVFIEFYCGGNYSPITSDKSKYTVLSDTRTSKRGVDKSGNYWRKDGKLSYFNCKAKDTVKYNRIFDNMIIN